MTQRPDLFTVAVPQVGVMDMLRYDRFTGGALWTTEYGASSDPKAFPFLFAYPPLHNIKTGVCYPATLVTTADYDGRVVPSRSSTQGAGGLTKNDFELAGKIQRIHGQ